MSHTIGILIPLCSRKQNWSNIFDIDFFCSFLPFFYSSISNKYNYRFYLAIDENDNFLINLREDIEKCLAKEDKIIIAPKTLNGNPCGIWNLLLDSAKDECEYFYQCGSDIAHITNEWDKYFINVLKKNNNLGICGGVDKNFWLERVIRNQSGILENVFFHKTHYDIFGRLFNEKFKTWFSDDYISELYRSNNLTFISSNNLYINTNRVGGHKEDNRYKPSTEMEKIWRDIAKEDSKLIDKYLKQSNADR